MLVKNTNNSAYTRAEKLLSYPMIESASSTGAHQQPQTVVRDLFGYTKVVMMPQVNNNAASSSGQHSIINKGVYELAPPILNVSKDSSMVDNSSQLGDILKDSSQQNRVVDNVMQFFRYKDNVSDKKKQ